MRYEAIESPKDCRHRVFQHNIGSVGGKCYCMYPMNIRILCNDDNEFPPADQCPLKVIFW